MKTLLLHGGPGLSNYWPMIFSRENLQTLEHMEFPSAVRIEDYIHALKDRLRGKDWKLVGHSFGGTVALEALTRGLLPETKKLILVGTPLSFHAQQIHLEEMQRLGLNPEDPLQVFLSEREQQDKSSCKLIMEILRSLNKQILEKMTDSYLFNLDLVPSLANLSIPCLIVSGSEDRRVPFASQRDLARFNHKLKFEVITGAGHFPFLLSEHKSEFLKIVQNF